MTLFDSGNTSEPCRHGRWPDEHCSGCDEKPGEETRWDPQGRDTPRYITEATRDKAYARTSDPEISHEAADSLTAVVLRESQRQVLSVAESMRDFTLEELVERYEATDIAGQSESGIRTRVKELNDAGFVADTGRRRLTRSGRKARVLETRSKETH